MASKRASSAAGGSKKPLKASKTDGAVPSEDSPVKVTALGTSALSADEAAIVADASYMRGFGGHFSTEALKGVLPARGNGPQRVCESCTRAMPPPHHAGSHH